MFKCAYLRGDRRDILRIYRARTFLCRQTQTKQNKKQQAERGVISNKYN